MRSKKAIKNIFWSGSYQIISIICGLVLPRLILGTFGSTYNGVVNSAIQFLSMIQILNLGIAGATKVALYKTLAKGDVLGTSRIYNATQNYMKKVAVAIVCYALVLMVVYPFILHTDLGKIECAILVGIVAVRTFAEYFFGITNKTLITADQSGYISYIFNIIATIANTVLAYILICFGCSVFSVYAGSSIVFLLNPLLLSLYVRRKYKIIRNCEPDNSALEARGAVAFHSIANIVHDRTDLIILTLFTDIKVVSVYTVYYLVVGKIKSIMRICTNGMEAAFGDMWVKKEMENLHRNFKAYEYTIYSFTCVVFSCVGVLILPFISLYTKKVTDINYVRLDLAILITIAEAFFCIRQPYLTLVEATGSYEQTKKGAAVEAGLNIVISLALVPFIGIVGVIIGTMCANIFRTCQYSLYVSKNILNQRISVVIRKICWAVLTSALSVGLSLFVIKLIPWTGFSWFKWIVESMIVFMISTVVLVFSSLLFYKNELMHLIRFMDNAIFKKTRK